VRYADDCNVYVRSRQVAEQVMEGLRRFIIRKLKLRVNQVVAVGDLDAPRDVTQLEMCGQAQGLRKFRQKAVRHVHPDIRALVFGVNGRPRVRKQHVRWRMQRIVERRVREIPPLSNLRRGMRRILFPTGGSFGEPRCRPDCQRLALRHGRRRIRDPVEVVALLQKEASRSIHIRAHGLEFGGPFGERHGEAGRRERIPCATTELTDAP
jgi:hypothetical protein